MNIISNLIFHCNNCDANRAFVIIRESTAVAPSNSLLNAKFTLKGTSPNVLMATLRWQSHYSIHRSGEPHATRKLHGSMFYRTGVITDGSFTLRE